MVKQESVQRVLQVLKAKEETVGQYKSKSELYAAISPELPGISEEEFAEIIKELREGEVNLDDIDLEGVAGGKVVVAVWLSPHERTQD